MRGEEGCGMWKVAVVAYFEILCQNLPGGKKTPRKTSTRIADLWDKSHNRDLDNMKQQEQPQHPGVLWYSAIY
jgi:hypothetical protein